MEVQEDLISQGRKVVEKNIQRNIFSLYDNETPLPFNLINLITSANVLYQINWPSGYSAGNLTNHNPENHGLGELYESNTNSQ